MQSAAQQETLLYSFGNSYSPAGSGTGVVAGFVIDSHGNLYGTNPYGGKYGLGDVYELANRNGTWKEKVLYSFDYGNTQHFFPLQFSSLIFDAAGNLYGTMFNGGPYDCGAVFETSLEGNGEWTTRALHNFNDNGNDGCLPMGSVTFDSAGNLYGTTQAGGIYGGGTVFELTPNSDGSWNEKILHHFGYGKDGLNPQGSVVFDAAGNLYSTTFYGGGRDPGNGTVFELSPTASGRWTEKLLYDFNVSVTGVNGSFPTAGVIFDAAGNLYGTTESGGSGNGRGTVFELTPTASGPWTETVLHTFNVGDGWNLNNNLVFDNSGNLYGTTSQGGLATDPAGTVFELLPAGDGVWTENILYSFSAAGDEGDDPSCALIFDAAGNLYGTTSAGGSGGGGTAFEIAP